MNGRKGNDSSSVEARDLVAAVLPLVLDGVATGFRESLPCCCLPPLAVDCELLDFPGLRSDCCMSLLPVFC